MCLPKENAAAVAASKGKLAAMTPRSPWRRLKQQLKPRLSRKVVSGAKINLNNFWSKFEELHDRQLPLMTAVLVQDNEINENILNEIAELRS